MMLTVNKFFLALAFLGGSAAAQAADEVLDLTRMPPGKPSERMNRTESESRHGASSVWRHGLSQRGGDNVSGDQSGYSVSYQPLSGTHNGAPVARDSLSGHYDVNLLQMDGTKLFSQGAIGSTRPLATVSSLTGSQQDWLPVRYTL
jgi:hypothetical protein